MKRRANVEALAFFAVAFALIVAAVAVLDVETFRRVVAVGGPVLLVLAGWVGWRSGAP